MLFFVNSLCTLRCASTYLYVIDASSLPSFFEKLVVTPILHGLPSKVLKASFSAILSFQTLTISQLLQVLLVLLAVSQQKQPAHLSSSFSPSEDGFYLVANFDEHNVVVQLPPACSEFRQKLQRIMGQVIRFQIDLILFFVAQMETTNAPQIIDHLTKSTNYTPYDVKWIPDSSKFVVCGERPKATGLIEITQLTKGELKVISTIDNNRGVKSGTFAASPSSHTCFAFGDLEGKLSILDLEKEKVFWQVQAHTKVVNSVDGAGAEGHGYGPCEIVSGGRDGSVRVWDPRQKTPVISLDPAESDVLPDCWTVSFGNAHNSEQRVVAAGYDNGDVKLFDLKTQMFLWDTNLRNGVCGVQFDRKDIIMNKLGAATLEGKYSLFDLRTFNPTAGYSSLTDAAQKATLWGIKHVPQNRDLFVTLGGNGALNLYKYHYPSQRSVKDSEGKELGVMGKSQLLNQRDICQQCISSFDWNRDKLGLSVLCGLDQTVRVMLVTKLNLY